MLRKGQGLPLNVIIIAAIVLIVLVIVIVIFSGRISIFNQGLNECVNGRCVQDRASCTSSGDVAVRQTCTTASGVEGNYCCIETT